MKQLVIMPGGFHPFHAGHLELYNSIKRVFPSADVYVAATNDTSTRPFPFPVKEKLAQLAGVPKGRFTQVKSPFRAEEITASYDPDTTQLIFVRSEKDKDKPPIPGGVKKDGNPGYLQPLISAKRLEPFARHAYMAYLPTIEFLPGMTGASDIRAEWPTLDEPGKIDRVMSLYPKTQTTPKLAATVVKLLDTAIGTVDESALDNLPRPNKRNQFKSLHRLRKQRGLDEQGMAEGDVVPFARPGQALTWQQVPKDILLLANDWFWASEDNSGLDAVIDPKGYGNGTANDVTYLTAKLQQKGWTIDYNDLNDGKGEFNLVLTNRRGNNVLLSINDAQSFTGWAAGTNPVNENTAPNPRVDLTPNYPNYATLVGEFIGVKKNRVLFRIVSAELKPGQGETEKIFRAMSTNTPIGIEIGRVKNRAVVENIDKEFILYIDGKPAAKYMDQQQAILDMAAVRKKYPSAKLELKHEVCTMQTVQQVNEGGSILEVLKPDAFAALQQAKQRNAQNRQQEVDQWAQDFRANSSKLAGQQLKQAVNPPPVPVAQPGEKHAVLKNRISQLDQAINKQQQLDALTQKLEHKGLLTPAMQMDFDTRMYVRDAAADDYQALNQKLDRAIVLATNRLRTNKLAFKEAPDYIEEGRKI